MKLAPAFLAFTALIALSLPACRRSGKQETEAEQSELQRKIVVTSPEAKDVVHTEQYVSQIHSCRHIELRALETGYLEGITVKEGQAVKQGDLLFKLVPTLFQAKLDSEAAEAELARIEFNNTQKLFAEHVVSDKEVALAKAKLAKAVAKLELAQAELNFTEVKAPFDGIIDRLYEQQGSLIEEGDMLTTLSDNNVMWVYFNVPEARYLDFMTNSERGELKVELKLANGEIFPQAGKIGAIEADFDNATGNIAFRADFPNPEGLLRHGQTGTVLLSHVLKNAIVIPQRSTFEILAKRYVYVVGEDGAVHQRDIEIDHTMDDIYVLKGGVAVDEKIVLEGVLQVHDGQKVEFEYESPQQVLSHLKYQAE